MMLRESCGEIHTMRSGIHIYTIKDYNQILCN
jgi:hypothetical protein